MTSPASGTVVLDLSAIARTAAFFAGSVVLVAVTKVARDKLAARRGHRLPDRVVIDNNVAVGVEMAGFFLAMVLGLLGGLVIQGTAWWEQLQDLLVTWVVVSGVLLANDQIVSRFILRGLDCNQAVAEDANLAVAVVRAAANVATALVLRGALQEGGADIFERFIWVLIGQAALIGLSLAYQALTRYDDVREVRSKNVAAALPMAGVLLAVAVVVEAALAGGGGPVAVDGAARLPWAGFGADLTELVLELAVAAVLIVALRWAGDRLLLPGASYHDEIARDKNAGVGFIEAATYVAAGVAVAYFLN